MSEAAPMFAPLSWEERTTASEAKDAAPTPDGWHTIQPVPQGAPKAEPHPRLGKPSTLWRFRDFEGRTLGFTCRFDKPDGGKEILPLTFWKDGTGHQRWRWTAFPVSRPLYGLDRLAAHPNAPVIVTEGEKAADGAATLFPDHVAVTSPGGCKAAGKANWTPLKGRHVVVWPDNDEAGVRYAEAVGRLCRDS